MEQQYSEVITVDALASNVREYIDNRRWDTLVGRAFEMHSPEGRQEFAEFLSTHIRGLLKYMDSKSE